MFAVDSRRCLPRHRLAGVWRRNRRGFLCGLLLLTCVSHTAHGQTGKSYPSQIYFSTFRAVAEGDFPAALKWFQNAARSGVRSSQGRWIDSICYYAMTGECFYQLGDYDHALENYDAALQLFFSAQRLDAAARQVSHGDSSSSKCNPRPHHVGTKQACLTIGTISQHAVSPRSS